MEIDEAAQLGTKLDEWLDGSLATFASEDRPAQTRALVRALAIEKEISGLTAEGLATLRALLDRQDAATEQQRAAALLQGFAFGARFADALHDQLLDTENYNKVLKLMTEIVNTLDGIGSGRSALAALLEHRDADVRAHAGARLIDLMPDRVVPILREIDRDDDGSSASFAAHWGLLIWEREQKAK